MSHGLEWRDDATLTVYRGGWGGERPHLRRHLLQVHDSGTSTQEDLHQDPAQPVSTVESLLVLVKVSSYKLPLLNSKHPIIKHHITKRPIAKCPLTKRANH